MELELHLPRYGYVRCGTELPVLAFQLQPIPDMPTRIILGVRTEDGTLALGLNADSVQELADQLARAAAAMRTAPSWKW
jgi:hypothetical protein